MEWRDRGGNYISEGDEGNKSLKFLYETRIGGVLLGLLIRKPVSDIAGWFMQRRISALWINGFIRKNHIDMSGYEKRKFKSFNDFFTRRILPECRPVDSDPKRFVHRRFFHFQRRCRSLSGGRSRERSISSDISCRQTRSRR